MYYWAHTEAPAAMPATPGRIQTAAWPPAQENIINVKTPDQSTPSARRKKLSLDNKLESPKGENEIFNMKMQFNDCESINYLNCSESNVNNQRIKELENQITNLSRELDRYKTLVEIQSLTQNALRDFG